MAMAYIRYIKFHIGLLYFLSYTAWGLFNQQD